MTNAGPRRLCIRTGEWGSSAQRGGKFYSAAQAKKYFGSEHAVGIEQARRKDAAYNKAQLDIEYRPRRGPLSHTTGTASRRSSSSQSSQRSDYFTTGSDDDSTTGGGGAAGGAVAGDEGSGGMHGHVVSVQWGKRQRDDNGGDIGRGSKATKKASTKKASQTRKFSRDDMFEARDCQGSWYPAVVRSKSGNNHVVHFVGWPRAYDEVFTPVDMKNRTRQLGGDLIWQTPLWDSTKSTMYEIAVEDEIVTPSSLSKTRWLEQHQKQQLPPPSPSQHEQHATTSGESFTTTWAHVPRAAAGNQDSDTETSTGKELDQDTIRKMDSVLRKEYFKRESASPQYDNNGVLRVQGSVDFMFENAHSIGIDRASAMAKRRKDQTPTQKMQSKANDEPEQEQWWDVM
jgi:hypothetical protein